MLRGLRAIGCTILPAFSPRLLGGDLAISYSICSCQVRALALGLSDLHECRLSKPVHLVQLLLSRQGGQDEGRP